MKRIKYFIFGVLLFIMGANITSAASLSVSASKRTVTVGSTVNITVTASGSDGWEYCLNYDSSIFSLVSTTSDTGGPCVKTGITLIGYSKVNYTLKANKSGSSTIGLRDAAMYDALGESIQASTGSVTLTAKTQQEIEASYSTDANLKDLNVDGYELTPEFDKNTTEYTLDVENDVEKINIKATRSDSSAHITGTGEKELSEGINKFEIVVTAEKGNKKTYTLTVNRKELNPISVTVSGSSYNVVRKSESLEAPTYYTATTTVIDDVEVPAFTSEITGYTLVGLKDEEGTIDLYIYENGAYRLYKQVGTEGFIFIIEETNDAPKNYENKKTIKINEMDAEVYCKDNYDEIVLIYGMNASTGTKNWYKYDTKEGTFQRYIEDTSSNLLNKNEYFYLVLAFAAGLALAILIILALLVMISKKDKQRKKLISIIESKMSNKEEKNKEQIENEENVSEPKETVEVEEQVETKPTPKKSKKKAKKKEEEKIDPEMEKLNAQFLDFIEKTEREENQTEKELSKRELRRLEKEQKDLEEQELKAMRDDFLSTRENTIVDDSDILDEIEENKKAKKSPRKKNSGK